MKLAKTLFEQFVTPLKEEAVEVNIFLNSGAKLSGVVTKVADDGITLEKRGAIYVSRASIASVVPYSGDVPADEEHPRAMALYHQGRKVL
ncbi:hypothetical protein EBZ38_03890 [bacterium]|nr:hypothetical protein [bacterium]